MSPLAKQQGTLFPKFAGINWAAKVVLEGPQQNPNAVSQIHVGSIEHVKVEMFSADYLQKGGLFSNDEVYSRKGNRSPCFGPGAILWPMSVVG